MERSSAVMARLRASEPMLGPSERRVAQVVLARPADVSGWSTSELAVASQTSPATVIRACQSLGFRGFQHLRLELARATPDAQEPQPHATGMLFDAAIDALRLARDSIDPGAIQHAVAILEGARRLVLVGNGFSGPPLQDAALRIATLGRSVEAPIDALAQQFTTHGLGASDAVLAVSYSGANAQTLAACRAAADRGAAVVAVTSFGASPVARAATLAITTATARGGHEVDPFLSRLAHQVVLQGIHDGLAERLGSGSTDEMRHVVADALADD